VTSGPICGFLFDSKNYCTISDVGVFLCVTTYSPALRLSRSRIQRIIPEDLSWPDFEEADYSLSSSAEVKNEWNFPFSPFIYFPG
jgi:hypothetical protein